MLYGFKVTFKYFILKFKLLFNIFSVRVQHVDLFLLICRNVAFQNSGFVCVPGESATESSETSVRANQHIL
jgi:hypothetical protein